MILDHIHAPRDVQNLAFDQLDTLCQEVRETIIKSAAMRGGHLGSNLAAVELTVALHYVFNSPIDKLIFDVSHQTYAHKILTGRAEAYLHADHESISGFSCPRESEHDLFSMGHTSTSISLACGFAHARELNKDSYQIIAVIGDGALSGGLAFEGLNNAAEICAGIIIIVNDNEWSIAENHGGLYSKLAELRRTGGTAPHNPFRALGLTYHYLEDGNNVYQLVDVLKDLRNTTQPVVLHIHTQKGSGYQAAQNNPEGWHNVGPFDIASACKQAPATGEVPPHSWFDITGRHLMALMEQDERIVCVNAATPYVLGFTPNRRAWAAERFVDVGIAEAHAASFSTALAAAGKRPVFGVYGTFLQRAYDQLWHDICLNDVPVTIIDAGASIFGAKAETHLGFFDIAMLSGLPHIICLAPTCKEEYLAMLSWAATKASHPVLIRIPGISPASSAVRGSWDPESFDAPEPVTVHHGSDIAIVALGSFLELGQNVWQRLKDQFDLDASLINPRVFSSIDSQLVKTLSQNANIVVTLEDGVLDGGWGERLIRELSPYGIQGLCYGLKKQFIDQYDPTEVLKDNRLDPLCICKDILRIQRMNDASHAHP